MKKLLQMVCALGVLIPGVLSAASPFEPPHKSVSSSQQFTIYCDDLPMRLQISSFCETTKSGILGVLMQKLDNWKIPIVINIFRPDATTPGQPLTQIGLYDVEGGTRKIEVNVTLRGELGDLHFQQLIVRAILTEMEYRDKPDWKEGVPAIEPPSWLVEGFSTYLRNRNTDMDVDVYKTLLKNSELPTLEAFLTETTDGMNASSLKLYQAYSYGFFYLLATGPDGPQALAAYIHDLPLGKDTLSEDLVKHFPALGGSTDSLEKWWMLSMAHIAASDRFKGLSLEETDQRLLALLKFKLPAGKNGETKEFAIEDFKQFIKDPQAQPVIADAGTKLEVFAAEANPLFRPIIGDYLVVIKELQSGKTRHTADELKNIAKYREMILTRMDQIADYLNWFEATQMENRSDSFKDYLKAAKELTTEEPKRNDAISRYLDSLEIQMQ